MVLATSDGMEWGYERGEEAGAHVGWTCGGLGASSPGDGRGRDLGSRTALPGGLVGCGASEEGERVMTLSFLACS